MIAYLAVVPYCILVNAVEALPRKIGDITVQAFEDETHTHVNIALVRFKSADVFGVALGQKYGLRMMRIDLPK